ncbi:MAG: Gfo/Idh/MocA family oxidoreductase [Clostridiales bacterium]|nr:Gfo/Idh/MocA family oxidoreductase [Clostridiales bacterium]
MADKLRIGIIGTGGIAHSHVNAYKNFPDVEVVAGADIIPGKARAFLDKFDLKDATAYESHEELCKRDDIDAVSVCTYNSQHSVCSVAALESGKDVLLEKPMAITLQQGIDIMRAEKKSGKFVTVGFQPRYDANSVRIKQIVQSGELGKIYYVQTGGGRRRGIPGGTFIEKDKAGVGALADIGCYALDLALNTIGYPKPLTVSAIATNYIAKNPKYYAEPERFEVDDFSAAFIRLEGGITLDFRMSWGMHMDTTGDFIFLGSEGGLKVKQPHYQLWGGAWDGPVGDIIYMHDQFGIPTQTPIPLAQNDKASLFEKKVRAFVDAVKTKGPAPIPTSQIIYNQAIIDGIIRSSAAGEEVKVVFPKI